MEASQPPALGRAGFTIALLLTTAYAVVFLFGAAFMVVALYEVLGRAPASGWSSACALIGLALQLAGAAGIVMVGNALAPYTGLQPLALPKWKRSHADLHH